MKERGHTGKNRRGKAKVKHDRTGDERTGEKKIEEVKKGGEGQSESERKHGKEWRFGDVNRVKESGEISRSKKISPIAFDFIYLP